MKSFTRFINLYTAQFNYCKGYYLTNRKQYVVFNSQNSETVDITTGVPQGSILGPLLFSICINDLITISNKLKFIMYADDTTIYFNLEDFDPGPLLFSICIDDLITISNKLKFIMYADDTTIYFNLEDFDPYHLKLDINNELEKITLWLKMNKLSLNVQKQNS